MIGALCLAFAARIDGDDSINLARAYRLGESESYWMRISPEGTVAPLGNAFSIRFMVSAGPKIIVEGAESPYSSSRQLACWKVAQGGFVKSVVSSQSGFSFLPYAFTTNDVPLNANELESIGGGSVKLLNDKDSVAKLRIWLPISKDLFLSEEANVEIATRRLNYGSGTLYQRRGRKLEAVRTFTIEREKPLNPQPISQASGGDF